MMILMLALLKINYQKLELFDTCELSYLHHRVILVKKKPVLMK